MQPKYKLQNDNPENVYLKIDISICPDPIFFFFGSYMQLFSMLLLKTFETQPHLHFINQLSM